MGFPVPDKQCSIIACIQKILSAAISPEITWNFQRITNKIRQEKELDFSQSYMLYEVGEDEEHNPIVMYIEDDLEYAIAAQYFSKLLSK